MKGRRKAFSTGLSVEEGGSWAYSVIAGISAGGSVSRAPLIDDLRRSCCSNTSGSLLRLTTRWDTSLIIDPARTSGEALTEGDRERGRPCGVRVLPYLPDPDIPRPDSTFGRSSPSFAS